MDIDRAVTMRALDGRANEPDFFCDCRAYSAKAREEPGWRPHRPGVVDDLAALPKPLGLHSVYRSRSARRRRG